MSAIIILYKINNNNSFLVVNDEFLSVKSESYFKIDCKKFISDKNRIYFIIYYNNNILFNMNNYFYH